MTTDEITVITNSLKIITAVLLWGTIGQVLLLGAIYKKLKKLK